MKLLKKNSYAKINLGLEILNHRKDGYSNIKTIFFLTGLHDEITLESSNSFSVECDIDLGIPQEKNLIYKAALAFAEINNLPDLPVKITVKKNIPSGAGLGGGSSNAAMTFLALEEFLGLDHDPDKYLKPASIIGSDVPFFLKGDTCEASGRGEILEPFKFDLKLPILIVNPGIHVSTAEAYSLLRRNEDYESKSNFREVLLSESPEKWKKEIFNDFESVVFPKHPAISDIKNALYASGALFALMSGSGSSVFGIFPNNRKAEKAIAKFSGLFTHLTRIPE